MQENIFKIYKQLKKQGLSNDRLKIIERELDFYNRKKVRDNVASQMTEIKGLYDKTDFDIFIGIINKFDFTLSLQTLDELLDPRQQARGGWLSQKDQDRQIH